MCLNNSFLTQNMDDCVVGSLGVTPEPDVGGEWSLVHME